MWDIFQTSILDFFQRRYFGHILWLVLLTIQGKCIVELSAPFICLFFFFGLIRGWFLLHMTLDCKKRGWEWLVRTPWTKQSMERSFPIGLGCSVHWFLWRGDSGGAWHSYFKKYVTSSNSLIFLFFLTKSFHCKGVLPAHWASACSHGWPLLATTFEMFSLMYRFYGIKCFSQCQRLPYG